MTITEARPVAWLSKRTPAADALSIIDQLETPVGPGSTIAAVAVAVADSIKVRVAEALVARGTLPPVLASASVVGDERPRELFDRAYREHARRMAGAVGGGGA